MDFLNQLGDSITSFPIGIIALPFLLLIMVAYILLMAISNVRQWLQPIDDWSNY